MMNSRGSGHCFGVVTALLGGLLLATMAHAASFTARSVESAPQQATREGQLYVADDRMRWESSATEGERRIQIAAPKERKAWLLLPDQQAYLEIPLPPASESAGQESGRPGPCAQPEVQCERLGVETLNGRPAVKWELRVPAEGHPVIATIWLDQVHGFAVREEVAGQVASEWRYLGDEQVSGRTTEKWERTFSGPDGEVMHMMQWYDPELEVALRQQMPGGQLRELHDIEVAPQPESLFTVPENYRKLPMPSDPQSSRPPAGMTTPGR